MLEVRKLDAGYGLLPVLRAVDLDIRAGEITLLVGANGAGKSTLLRAIAGFLKPTAGRVTFDGLELAGRKPDEISRAGARLVLDGHRVFRDLSVWDNLRLGAAARRDRQGFEATIGDVLALFPILAEKRKLPAGSLSGGQQQMLALAQAFLGAPKLLMCDEPSLGLAQSLLPSIFDALQAWAARGTAILVVEQHVDIARPYASSVLQMDRGSLHRA
jgi:branched-chain amino acid transport system ATP-binding protein